MTNQLSMNSNTKTIIIDGNPRVNQLVQMINTNEMYQIHEELMLPNCNELNLDKHFHDSSGNHDVMSKIDKWNLTHCTQPQNENINSDVDRLLSSFCDLQESRSDFYEPDFNIIKKRRNKMTHLMPKKKKRKKSK